MNKLQKKIASAIAASALLLNTMPGVALAVSCTISSNGSETVNTCDFTTSREVNVDQNNDLDVDNDVDIQAGTGHNEAEDNTGGDVKINTGDVTGDVKVTTEGNTNAASITGTGSNHNFDLTIEDNGADSDNKVDVDVTDDVDVDQDNDSDVDNDVDVKGYTGKNEAEDNTGGSVKITSGDVDSGVEIATAVNANSAFIGGGDDQGTFSAMIKGNGSDTDNDIELTLWSEADVDQDNDSDVDNDVDVKGYTGKNEAEDNTGGDNEIKTGDVDVDVKVDTTGNFNQADVTGGFYFGDVELKIAENGNESDSDIDLDLTDKVDVDQDNDLDVDNEDVDVSAGTGKNELEDNTIGDGDDPAIETGDIDSSVELSTSGNANVFGGDHEVEVSFDMSELMSLLHALSALLGL